MPMQSYVDKNNTSVYERPMGHRGPLEHHMSDFPTMIIELNDNSFWQVRETGSADLAHVWLGVQGRFNAKTKVFTPKPNRNGSGNRPRLVSKAHCYRVHVAAN